MSRRLFKSEQTDFEKISHCTLQRGSPSCNSQDNIKSNSDILPDLQKQNLKLTSLDMAKDMANSVNTFHNIFSTPLPPIKTLPKIQAKRPTSLIGLDTSNLTMSKRPGSLPQITQKPLCKGRLNFGPACSKYTLTKIEHFEKQNSQSEVTATTPSDVITTIVDPLAVSGNVLENDEDDPSGRLEKVLRKIGNVKIRKRDHDERLACAKCLNDLDTISKEVGFERMFQRAIDSPGDMSPTCLSPIITKNNTTVVPWPAPCLVEVERLSNSTIESPKDDAKKKQL
ncbi:unnamed protein product [Owenia fusiformis]|uniref:Uncharacterized protein n=1 Tax=Owenia fusiformis TaxID=6347 RepID=A0A8J1Y2C4_OWEFU|nr:unnamed protein product [Owenia fusiformis]